MSSVRPRPKSKPAQPADTGTTEEDNTEDSAYQESIYQDPFFAPQRTSTAVLGSPRVLVENLAVAMVEVLAGARELEQIQRWISDATFRKNLKRSILSQRARDRSGKAALRPSVEIRRTRVSHICDGVAEAVVVVGLAHGVRSVAIRLEGLDGRWLSTELTVI